MAQWTAEAEQILLERFGKDSLISLATVSKGIPYVRIVNTFYWDGAFYVLTDARSHKMHQLAEDVYKRQTIVSPPPASWLRRVAMALAVVESAASSAATTIFSRVNNILHSPFP